MKLHAPLAPLSQTCLAMYQTPSGRWTLTAEQTTNAGIYVSLLFQEPAWDMYGVLREWRFEHRAAAFSFVTRLRRLLAPIDERVAPHDLLRRLPRPQAA